MIHLLIVVELVLEVVKLEDVTDVLGTRGRVNGLTIVSLLGRDNLAKVSIYELPPLNRNKGSKSCRILSAV